MDRRNALLGKAQRSQGLRRRRPRALSKSISGGHVPCSSACSVDGTQERRIVDAAAIERRVRRRLIQHRGRIQDKRYEALRVCAGSEEEVGCTRDACGKLTRSRAWCVGHERTRAKNVEPFRVSARFACAMHQRQAPTDFTRSNKRMPCIFVAFVVLECSQHERFEHVRQGNWHRTSLHEGLDKRSLPQTRSLVNMRLAPRPNLAHHPIKDTFLGATTLVWVSLRGFSMSLGLEHPRESCARHAKRIPTAQP